MLGGFLESYLLVTSRALASPYQKQALFFHTTLGKKVSLYKKYRNLSQDILVSSSTADNFLK